MLNEIYLTRSRVSRKEGGNIKSGSEPDYSRLVREYDEEASYSNLSF